MGEFKDGVGTLKNGIKDYTDGASTLSTGIGTLKSGVDTLAGSVPTLISGVGTLKDGSASAAKGASSLKDGAGTLKKGAKDVSTGANTLWCLMRNSPHLQLLPRNPGSIHLRQNQNHPHLSSLLIPEVHIRLQYYFCHRRLLYHW